MTALIPIDTLGQTIRAHLDKGDKAAGKAEDHYRAAGLHLVEARNRIAAEGGKFDAFLAEYRIGRSRAFELIAVAEGKKTLDGIRARTAERVARHAEKNKEARVLSESLSAPVAESVSNGQSEMDALRQYLLAAQIELARLKEVHERLRREHDDLLSALAELDRTQESNDCSEAKLIIGAHIVKYLWSAIKSSEGRDQNQAIARAAGIPDSLIEDVLSSKEKSSSNISSTDEDFDVERDVPASIRCAA